MKTPGADLKIQKDGAESSSLPPPPLLLEWKLHFSGYAAYSIVRVFVMQSKVGNVNVSEDRIKEHFIKRFS